jgi:hypothetical protein
MKISARTLVPMASFDQSKKAILATLLNGKVPDVIKDLKDSGKVEIYKYDDVIKTAAQ